MLSGLIAFHSFRDGNNEIYTMNADGTAQTRLTDNVASDQEPVWSPDGTKFAFDSGRDGNSEIYVMNVDGTEPTRLTYSPATDGSGAWSPDSTKIAFHSFRDGNQEIYVMNADGTGLMNVTNHAANDTFRGTFVTLRTWSPDGTKIVFQSNRDGNQEIYVVNSDGTGLTNLTNHAAVDSLAAWSPDGTKIAFSTFRDGNSEIYLTNEDGTGLPFNLTNNTALDDNPVWSPDGTKIAFRSNRDGNIEIYVMNADGTGQTNVTNHARFEQQPTWTPDGKVGFISNRDGNDEIYVVNADGTGLTRLTNHPAYDRAPAWQPELADIDVLSANLQGANTVEFTYETSSNPGPFELGLYQSTDGITYNALDLIQMQTVTPDPGGSSGTGLFAVGALESNPDLPYLLVVADPSNAISEADEENNSTSIELADLAIDSVRLIDPVTIGFDYQTVAFSGMFNVGVFRSSDTEFDLGTDVQLGALQPYSSTNGMVRAGLISLANELEIDPSRPYVLVVADPYQAVLERDETNNSDDFKKWLIGVVVHGGNQFTNAVPGWANTMASSLRDQRYDMAYAFDWSAEVRQWQEGMTGVAAIRLAAQLTGIAEEIPREDVVDLHIIGHSRGAIVAAETLENLRNAGHAERYGFVKFTMLDPHPARNERALSDGIRELLNYDGVSTIGSFSYLPVHLTYHARAQALAFQDRVQDPLAFVASNADVAELYYQRNLWSELPLLSLERVLNLWGQSPDTIEKRSSSALFQCYLNGESHTGVREWYQSQVVPTLGTSAVFFCSTADNEAESIDRQAESVLQAVPLVYWSVAISENGDSRTRTGPERAAVATAVYQNLRAVEITDRLFTEMELSGYVGNAANDPEETDVDWLILSSAEDWHVLHDVPCPPGFKLIVVPEDSSRVGNGVLQ